MKTEESKVTIHMVSSLDGYIAKKDQSVSWLESSDQYEKGIALHAEQMDAFIDGIDCYVIGSQTYEHALQLGWPYGDKPVFVLTHRDLKPERSEVKKYSGDLGGLVNDKLKPDYQNIWVAGGATVTKDFIRSGLADEIIVSIMPVILGDGIPFFDHIGQEQLLHLKDVTAYKDGMVELWYEIKRE